MLRLALLVVCAPAATLATTSTTGSNATTSAVSPSTPATVTTTTTPAATPPGTCAPLTKVACVTHGACTWDTQTGTCYTTADGPPDPCSRFMQSGACTGGDGGGHQCEWTGSVCAAVVDCSSGVQLSVCRALWGCVWKGDKCAIDGAPADDDGDDSDNTALIVAIVILAVCCLLLLCYELYMRHRAQEADSGCQELEEGLNPKAHEEQEEGVELEEPAGMKEDGHGQGGAAEGAVAVDAEGGEDKDGDLARDAAGEVSAGDKTTVAAEVDKLNGQQGQPQDPPPADTASSPSPARQTPLVGILKTPKQQPAFPPTQFPKLGDGGESPDAADSSDAGALQSSVRRPPTSAGGSRPGSRAASGADRSDVSLDGVPLSAILPESHRGRRTPSQPALRGGPRGGGGTERPVIGGPVLQREGAAPRVEYGDLNFGPIQPYAGPLLGQTAGGPVQAHPGAPGRAPVDGEVVVTVREPLRPQGEGGAVFRAFPDGTVEVPPKTTPGASPPYVKAAQYPRLGADGPALTPPSITPHGDAASPFRKTPSGKSSFAPQGGGYVPYGAAPSHVSPKRASGSPRTPGYVDPGAGLSPPGLMKV